MGFLYQDTPKFVAVSTGTRALLTRGHKRTKPRLRSSQSPPELRRPIHEFGVITLQLILWPIDPIPRFINPSLQLRCFHLSQQTRPAHWSNQDQALLHPTSYPVFCGARHSDQHDLHDK